MKLEIADIATNEKKRLNGFKVLGVFPFYLKYITTKTHIQICRIKEEIHMISGDEIKVSDFYNSELQAQVIPLINQYIVTALINNRNFGWLFKIFLLRKLSKCGHSHLFNLYMTIHKLDEPAFFFGYWKLITKVDHTLLKEVTPLLEKSGLIKKSSGEQ